MNAPVTPKHIMILTGEPSGDLHGARLVSELKKKDSTLYFSGIGGPNLKKEQVDLFYTIDRLSVMGFTEIIMQLGHIRKAFACFQNKIKLDAPDLLILIDYPGFNLKAAEFVKKNSNIRILYYITPKVWAWKKNRLKKIKKYVDHSALILPFEENLFKKAGIACTYVGNPLLEEYPEHLSKPFARTVVENEYGLTIGLLPGSRKTEVKKLGPILKKVSRLLINSYPNIRFCISKASSIDRKFLENFFYFKNLPPNYEICEGPAKDIFQRSDLIIAASGTVTLEAALWCVPTIIIYKVSYLSYRIAKFLVHIKFAGLANLIVNKEVMPELLQDDANPEKIHYMVKKMVSNLNFYENRLKSVRQFLGKSGAARTTANIAMMLIK